MSQILDCVVPPTGDAAGTSCHGSTWLRAGRRLAELDLALTLAAAPTLMFPGWWTVVGLALIALGWLGRWLAHGRPSVATALDWPIGLLLLMAVVGTASSAFPEASASKLWGLALGAALYYAVVNRLATARWRAVAAGGLVGVGAAVALAALVGTDWTYGRVVGWPWLEELYDRLPVLVRGLPGSGIPRQSDLFNPREVGGTLALLLPLAAVFLWPSTPMPWPQRVGVAAASILMGVVLLLTQTMGAVVGVVVSLGLAVAVADGRRRIGWLATGAAVAAAALAVGWTRLGGLGLLLETEALDPLTRPGREHALFAVTSRLEAWPRALSMIHDTPYTGIGLNTFPWVMDRFYSGFVLGPEPHAHNVFLQTGVDLGLPGLVAFVWLLAAAALALTTVYRRATDATARAVALGLGAGLGAHVLFGLTDAVTLGAKPGAALWVMLGLSLALHRSTVATIGRDAARLRRLGIAMVILTTLALLVPLTWDGPTLNAGRLLAYRGLQSAAAPQDTTALAAAAEHLERALSADPTNSGTWYLLGSVLASRGQDERAVEALRRGVMLDSRAPLERYALALALGRPRGAVDWGGLQRVYAQWTARYPQRAVWYVAAAVASCEGQGDGQTAEAALHRAGSQGATPAGIVAAYQGRLRSADACVGTAQAGRGPIAAQARRPRPGA